MPQEPLKDSRRAARIKTLQRAIEEIQNGVQSESENGTPIDSEALDHLSKAARAVLALRQSEKPQDPAFVAAGIMLKSAIAGQGLTDERVAADGAVVVVRVSDSCWANEVSKAWTEEFRVGVSPRPGESERWHTPTQDDWYVWLPEEDARQNDKKKQAEIFSQAVAAGCHILGVSADTAWLPKDLVKAADHVIELHTLCALDVQEFILRLVGSPTISQITDEQAALLTPRILRLARRPDQTADAYICKLLALVDEEAKPATPGKTTHDSPRSAPSLDRLHGMREATAWGCQLASDLAAYRVGQIGAEGLDKGLLLSGPPGVGKSLFARALATTCGIPLITGSYSSWNSTGMGHQGDLLQAMRKTFTEARKKAPCILFVDEIDSFPDRSKVTHHYADWERQVVNALLAEIDGAVGNPGVVLVGACNQPEELDPALTRSGRLDRHMRIGLPDSAALIAIFAEHLSPDTVEGLSTLAFEAAGSTGADVERYVRGARRRARLSGRALNLEDLRAEVGGEDNSTQAEKWTYALHEAGHAVAAAILLPNQLQSVKIGGDGGSTHMRPESSKYMTAREVHDRIVFILSGRAVEVLEFGEPSSGCGGRENADIARATMLSATAHSAWGLHTLLWKGPVTVAKLPEVLASDPVLAARVERDLDLAFQSALDLLGSRRKVYRDLARQLLQKRILEGVEVEEIVKGSAKTCTPCFPRAI